MASHFQTAKTLAESLFSSLKQMHVECSTGLCDYQTHTGLGDKQHERACCVELRDSLGKAGNRVDPGERVYPGERDSRGKKCDIYVVTPAQERVWLEVKPAWRQWFYDVVKRNDDNLYLPYFFGPKAGGWHKTHSVAQDLQKLERLTKADADLVCLLGIGFDSAEGEVARDLAKLAEDCDVKNATWHTELQSRWVDHSNDACFLHCWLWWRDSTT